MTFKCEGCKFFKPEGWSFFVVKATGMPIPGGKCWQYEFCTLEAARRCCGGRLRQESN